MVTNSTHAVAVTEAKFSAPEIKEGYGLSWSWQDYLD